MGGKRGPEGPQNPSPSPVFRRQLSSTGSGQGSGPQKVSAPPSSSGPLLQHKPEGSRWKGDTEPELQGPARGHSQTVSLDALAGLKFPSSQPELFLNTWVKQPLQSCNLTTTWPFKKTPDGKISLGERVAQWLSVNQ